MTSRTFRIDRGDHRPRPTSQARAYVYVLPCHGEELLKLGFSRSPLERLQTLHSRYFEFFDLERAFLIETDRVADARRIERLLGNHVAVHSAPAPLVVPRSAAGHTEWYRGAYDALRAHAAELGSGHGYRLHFPLREWLQVQLKLRQPLLYDWSQQQLDGLHYAQQVSPGCAESLAIERVLLNALDAQAALDCLPDAAVPHGVLAWYLTRRNGLAGRSLDESGA